jgi:hypothetical protein
MTDPPRYQTYVIALGKHEHRAGVKDRDNPDDRFEAGPFGSEAAAQNAAQNLLARMLGKRRQEVQS